MLRFIGPTRTAEIPDFLAALTRQLPTAGARLVFDLRELEGHNLDTRAPIQAWLLEHRSRIASVTVVVSKLAKILRMAAQVVAMATGLQFTICDELPEGAFPLNP